MSALSLPIKAKKDDVSAFPTAKLDLAKAESKSKEYLISRSPSPLKKRSAKDGESSTSSISSLGSNSRLLANSNSRRSQSFSTKKKEFAFFKAQKKPWYHLDFGKFGKEAYIIGLIATQMACSTLLICSNKYLMAPTKFPYVTELVCLQSGFVWFSMFLAFQMAPGIFSCLMKNNVFSNWDLLNIYKVHGFGLSMISTCFSLNVITSVSAYKYISVSLAQMMKNWQPVIGYPLESMFLRSGSWNVHIFNVLIFVSLAGILTIHGVVSMSIVGVGIQMFSLLFQTIQLMLQAAYLNAESQGEKEALPTTMEESKELKGADTSLIDNNNNHDKIEEITEQENEDSIISSSSRRRFETDAIVASVEYDSDDENRFMIGIDADFSNRATRPATTDISKLDPPTFVLLVAPFTCLFMFLFCGFKYCLLPFFDASYSVAHFDVMILALYSSYLAIGANIGLALAQNLLFAQLLTRC